jgi:hypothetical protein
VAVSLQLLASAHPLRSLNKITLTLTLMDDRDEGRDYEFELATLISTLQADPLREAIASELEVLQSIYEPGAVRVWYPPAGGSGTSTPRAEDGGPVRYELRLRYAFNTSYLFAPPSTYRADPPGIREPVCAA